MNEPQLLLDPGRFGGWDDAERLRRWSFQQRTPQQRLDWLVQALELAYQRGALTSDAEARS